MKLKDLKDKIAAEKQQLQRNSELFFKATLQDLSSKKVDRSTQWVKVASFPMAELQKYTSRTPVNDKVGPPLLMCFALINSPDILSLDEKHSLTQKLIESGYTIYRIQWHAPNVRYNQFTLDDYVLGGIKPCVQWLANRHACKVQFLGVCQGGVLAMLATAYMQNYIASLCLMVTPMSTPHSKHLLIDTARQLKSFFLTNDVGVIPHRWLLRYFLALRPMRQKVAKYLHAIKSEDMPFFVAMEEWIYQGPDVSVSFLMEYIEKFYVENLLVRNEVKLNGQPIDLRRIQCPVLNIYGKHDHIVPPRSSRAMRHLFESSFYKEVEFNKGHIGLLIDKKITQKIANMLKERII
ncbi:MAG: alpha/beta fold hydrolase [Pseudomonadota bacterium]